jgi:hypothetical protein
MDDEFYLGKPKALHFGESRTAILINDEDNILNIDPAIQGDINNIDEYKAIYGYNFNIVIYIDPRLETQSYVKLYYNTLYGKCSELRFHDGNACYIATYADYDRDKSLLISDKFKKMGLTFIDKNTYPIPSIPSLIETYTILSQSMLERGVEHFVTYGSLLGLVREGRFIEGDDDLDFHVCVHSLNELMDILLEKECLLNIFLTFIDGLIQIEYRGVIIDFFIYHPREDFVIDYSIGGAFSAPDLYVFIDRALIYPLKQETFGELTAYIPAKPHEFLRYFYGERYLEPMSKDEYERRVVNNRSVVSYTQIGPSTT